MNWPTNQVLQPVGWIRVILSLLLLGCMTPKAFPQEFHGGFLAGLTSTQLDGDMFGGFNKTGVTLGVFVNRKLNDKGSFQAELRYYEKGSKEDDTRDGGTTYYKSKINYIEMPFLYQYHMKKFIFEGGISAGVLVQSAEEDFSGDIPDDRRVPFHRFELAGHTGFQYLFSPRWGGNFRFSYSMLPVRRNFDNSIGIVGPTYLSGKYSYNNCISVSLYYHLDRE